MAIKNNFRKVSSSEEFEPYFTKLEIMAKKDPKIQETIPEKQRKVVEKNGIFSYAMRFLVKRYVDNGWKGYCRVMGVKEDSI